MSQAMYAAVSGIRTNQTRLSVISNNLANVNTISFKSSNVNFKTLFADSLSRGTGPSSSSGGTNPRQVGSGVGVGDITVKHSQGGVLTTGRNSDVLISGEGFFTLSQLSSDGSESYVLTRAGNFNLDAKGNLVSSNGKAVIGTRTVDGKDTSTVGSITIPRELTIWKEISATDGSVVQTWLGAQESTTITTADLSDAGNDLTESDAEMVSWGIGADGAVNATYSNGDIITVQTNSAGTSREIKHLTAQGTVFSQSGFDASGTLNIADSVLAPENLQIRLATVVNPEGLIYAGNNNWEVSSNSGSPAFGIPNNGSRGGLETGALESSNVDIAMEFTNMIVSQRGLEAASKVISVQSDILRTIIGIV